MGYRFQVAHWYKIKFEEKEYPWPCQRDPDRMITIYNDDVLTRQDDGTFMKHTGLGCYNIIIPEEDLIGQDDAVNLEII